VSSRAPILHPTDFSPASRPAFVKAIDMARLHRRRVLIVHVLNPLLPVMSEEAISPPTYDQLTKALRGWAEKGMKRLMTQAKARGARVTSVIREGGEAQEIARLARSRRAAMIVMGTHGRTGVKRVLLGSVAARVLSLAACPVLTVRAG